MKKDKPSEAKYKRLKLNCNKGNPQEDKSKEYVNKI